MDEKEKSLKLGQMIKSLLKERSITMRKLSSLTGIDTATISRIVNGKQPVNLNHLEKLSHSLNVPIAKLLLAAGYDIENSPTNSNTSEVVDTIKEVFEFATSLNEQYILKHIKEELNKYEQYALTEEGQELITKTFYKKIDKISGIGPFVKQLEELYTKFNDNNLSIKKRAILGSGLLYFILSTDIIPDYIFPIGYIDDFIAINLVLNKLSKT